MLWPRLMEVLYRGCVPSLMRQAGSRAWDPSRLLRRFWKSMPVRIQSTSVRCLSQRPAALQPPTSVARTRVFCAHASRAQTSRYGGAPF